MEHLPKVGVICPQVLQCGVQLMVPFGLGEPPQGLLLGQVVAFAHVLCSLPSSAPSYRAQQYWRRYVLLYQRSGATGIAREFRLALAASLSSAPGGSCFARPSSVRW